MVVTLKQVKDALMPDEPNYKKTAAKFGPEALEHLETLIKTEPLLAAKAAYTASLIQHEHSISVLRLAASSSLADVRVAAAHGSKNLRSEKVKDILESLKNDSDEGVRLKALKSIEARRGNK
jgi:HEAT repeat protein